MRSRVVQTTPDPAREAPTNGPSGSEERRRGRISASFARRPLVAFFTIAFALTWVTVPLGTFMAAGPLIAALVVLGVVEGRAGIRQLGRRMIQWRVGWQWYAAALLVPLGVAFAAGGSNVALGASDAAFANLELSALVLLFVLRMVVPVFAPIGEEPGWRGFALPHMQSGRTPFAATLVLGLIVAAWHVPLIWISEEKFEPVMLIGTVAVTFFYTWLFNHTGGSVFMTMVAHAADGLVGAKLLADGGFHDAAATRFSVLYTAGWCLVAVVLVAADRRMWFAPMRTPALVTGGSPRTGSGRVAVTAAVVVLLVVVPLVGVAGARSASAPSRETYVERADAICQRTTDKTDAVVEDLGFTPSDGEARAATIQVVALARTELRQLRALMVPTDDTRAVAKLYRTMERAWDRIERAPHLLTEEPGPLAKATRLAEAYGLEVCGRG